MKNLIFILILLSLVSCNDRNPRIGVVEEKDLSQEQIDSILDEYNFVYSDLIFIDSTNQALLPVSTQRSYGRKRYGSSSYEAIDYPNYWNIFFFNTSNDETNLLTDSKIRISEFKYNIHNAGPILKNRILYEIGDTDYNQDKRYNYEDPLHLFISKIDGSDLIRLSPLNEHLTSYKIVPTLDKIIFRTTRDVDSDLDFDNEDEQIWYQIDLSKSNNYEEIIKPSERKLIEKLYFEHWLVKEKE